MADDIAAEDLQRDRERAERAVQARAAGLAREQEAARQAERVAAAARAERERDGGADPEEEAEVLEPGGGEAAPRSVFGTVRPKLSGPGNFSIWKFKMELLLDEAGVLMLAEMPATNENKQTVEYIKANRRAMMLLASNVEDSQMSYLRQTRWASDAWAQLTTVYATASLSHKLYLREQLRTIKQKEGETITLYVGRLKEIAVQLDAAEAPQPEQELLLTLLGGALPKYRECTVTLENYPGVLTLERGINALQAAELRLDLKDTSLDEPAGTPGSMKVFYAGPKKQGQQGKPAWKPQGKEMRACFYCQKLGHLKKDCRKMQADLANKGKEREGGKPPGGEQAHQADVAWQTNGLSNLGQGEWCVDSGASRHMCHAAQMFKDLQSIKGHKIYVADGRSMDVKAKGTVSLLLVHQGKETRVDLHDVLYVPKLHGNLISVSQLAQKGVKVSFDKRECVLSMDGIPMGSAFLEGKLYHLRIKTRDFARKAEAGTEEEGTHPRQAVGTPVEVCAQVNTKEAALITRQEQGDLWHDRLGHPGKTAMSRLASGGYVDGLPRRLHLSEEICRGCVEGKAVRRPFYPAVEPMGIGKPLRLTHGDLVGPMQVATVGGARYVLHLVDDATRYRTTYLLKTKDEADGRIRHYKAAQELATGEKMKELRTDRGTEFVNQALCAFLASNGIKHNLSAPYTPQQNGVVERANRTLMEKVRSMLWARRVRLGLWGEAVMTATYLINLTPRRHQKATPYELFTGRRGNVSYLKVFGCRAHVLLPPARRQKLDARSLQCIFTGYDPNCKAWRFFTPQGGLIVSRDAVFEEKRGGDAAHIPVGEDPQSPEALEWLEEGGVIQVDAPARAPVPVQPAPGQPQIPVPQHEAQDEQNIPEDADAAEPQQRQGQNPSPAVTRARARALAQVEQQQVLPVAPAPEAGWPAPQDDAVDAEDDLPGIVPGPRGMRSLADIPALPRDDAHYAFRAEAELGVPATYQEAMQGSEKEQWEEAIQSEMDSLLQNGTWELEKLPAGRRAIGNKWVFALKRDKAGNITRYKARLVAKGYSQIQGVDYTETFSPVARYTTLRLLLTVAAEQNLEILQLDIKTAFLHGDLEEEIFMKLPEGFTDGGNQGFHCKLLKSLYGLKQASRAWNEKLSGELRKLDFMASEGEPSLFLHRWKKQLYLLCYVDDLLIVGERNEVHPVRDELQKCFSLSDLGEASLFLGMELERDRKEATVILSQRRYGQDVLKRFQMESCKPASTPLPSGYKFHVATDEDSFPVQRYQSAVGSLMYLVTGTRPDLGFAVGAASRYLTCPTQGHWEGIMHIFRYLQGTLDHSLILGGRNGGDKTRSGGTPLIGYSDADWGSNDESRRSISGYIFMLGKSLLSWSSKRQQSPALSSTEAEYMSLTRASKEAMWLQGVIGELTRTRNQAVTIHVDNQSCIALARNPASHERTKHIAIQYHFIRHQVLMRRVDLVHCPTEVMIADFMTKGMTREKLTWTLSAIRLIGNAMGHAKEE